MTFGDGGDYVPPEDAKPTLPWLDFSPPKPGMVLMTELGGTLNSSTSTPEQQVFGAPVAPYRIQIGKRSPPPEFQPLTVEDFTTAMDVATPALDATGVGGAVSWIPDLVSGVVNLFAGNYVDAGLSAASMIPFFGAPVNAGRLGKKGLRAVQAAGETVAARGGRRASDFVVSPRGEAIPVPTGASGPSPTRAPGFQYTGGSGGHGLDSRVSGVRIMEGNANQGPRAVYMNSSGQTVNPGTGRTVPNSSPNAHHYLSPWK